ncbi:hypothetical protein LJK88_17125 [Paenibacillus sp. P26]|nr:hypothetical protein LJK88_17125 [Paenibacillus sp. P26]
MQDERNDPGRIPFVAVSPVVPIRLKEALALFTGHGEIPIPGLPADALPHGVKRHAAHPFVHGIICHAAEPPHFIGREEHVEVMVLDADPRPTCS